MLVDGAREVLGFSLNSLGYSLNTKNMTELRLAETKLNSLTPNIKAIVGDEMKGYMVQGDAAIGVTFSGEASEMLDKMRTYVTLSHLKAQIFGLTIW